MADGHAGDRAQGAPAPWGAAAVHRRRRASLHRLRHQHAPGGPARQLADLELRHRRRARVEDRIRAAKDTGLRNLPLHGLDQNRIWQAVVALACDLTAWTQTLALHGHPARRWEPKRLRLRLLSLPADLARHARTTVLHLPAHAPWANLMITGVTRLRALAVPG
jgi:Transposase DDE domain group 1